MFQAGIEHVLNVQKTEIKSSTSYKKGIKGQGINIVDLHAKKEQIVEKPREFARNDLTKH